MRESLTSPIEPSGVKDKKPDITGFEYNPDGMSEAAALVTSALTRARLVRREIANNPPYDGSPDPRIKEAEAFEREAQTAAKILDLVAPLPSEQEWLTTLQGHDRPQVAP